VSATRQTPPPTRHPVTMTDHVHQARRYAIIGAAALCDGRKSLVAARLACSRPMLDRWIRLYGLAHHFKGLKKPVDSSSSSSDTPCA
jgi:DNA-binding NtrC family response regulator